MNGASSSGKTSVAKSIQHLSSEPWLLIGVDTLIDLMPKKYIDVGEKSDEGFCFIPGNNHRGPTTEIQVGPFGRKFFDSCIKMIGTLSDDDYNLIIDEVILQQSVFDKYMERLNSHSIYIIKVDCALEKIQEREISRGDRSVGLANAQIDLVHQHNYKYDLEIDTTNSSPFDLAATILNFIKINTQTKMQ